MSMAMKNWSCSVTTAICNVPWFKTDIIHYYIYLFSLLFSLFLHRKGSLVEKIILTVCWCLDVWDDCFWKNLISKLFCKTNTYIFFFSYCQQRWLFFAYFLAAKTVCCHGFQISFSSEVLGFGLWKQTD